MRKFGFFAVTALVLPGIGGWIASTSQARVAAPIAGISIDPTQTRFDEWRGRCTIFSTP
jgi:hypothetical protein